MIALAAVCAGAGAQALDGSRLVWIENESFGFDTCASASASPSGDEVAAAVAVLRARAASDITDALQLGGVVLSDQQFMTLTPIAGALACGAEDTQMTFRVAAVDRVMGKFWSSDMLVRSDVAAPDSPEMAQIADHLARHFRGTVVSKASQ